MNDKNNNNTDTNILNTSNHHRQYTEIIIKNDNEESSYSSVSSVEHSKKRKKTEKKKKSKKRTSMKNDMIHDNEEYDLVKREKRQKKLHKHSKKKKKKQRKKSSQKKKSKSVDTIDYYSSSSTSASSFSSNESDQESSGVFDENNKSNEEKEVHLLRIDQPMKKQAANVSNPHFITDGAPRSDDSLTTTVSQLVKREDWMVQPPQRGYQPYLKENNIENDLSQNTDADDVSVSIIEHEIDEEEQKKKKILYIKHPSINEENPDCDNDIEETSRKKKQKAIGYSWQFGDNGSSWRMMKLQKVFDIAQNESRNIEDVAMERYGSIEDFQQALDEKAFLENQKVYNSKHKNSGDFVKKQSFSSSSYLKNRSSSTLQFQKPTLFSGNPIGNNNKNAIPNSHSSSVSLNTSSSSLEPPLPGIISSAKPISSITIPSSSSVILPLEPIMSTARLNKLKAQILKAKMMGKPNTEVLEKEYERQIARSQTQVISNVDIRGKIQGYGQSSSTSSAASRKEGTGKRHIKSKENYEKTHDRHGERVRYHAGEEEQTIKDLVREEKMGRHDYNRAMMSQISKDQKFDGSLDYMDESIEKIARQAILCEEKKREFAVADYKLTQNALEKCMYCYTQEKLPQISVVALGKKVYLGLPHTIDMTVGHCLIIPIQHALTSIECDDDVWDEIRNFMKCLIRMFDQQGKVVIFIEQATYFKRKRHTFIECIPISAEFYDQIPAFFKEGILETEEEWTQHQKIIDTSTHGIRKSMVSHLPYFHVWFDPNRGMGHVIENEETWPSWFGKEIVAGILDIDPSKWRNPKRIEYNSKMNRLNLFKKQFEPFDWTKMLK